MAVYGKCINIWRVIYGKYSSLSLQNPDFHGFHHHDSFVDEWNMRLAFFFGISVAIVIGGTFIHYLPDHG